MPGTTPTDGAASVIADRILRHGPIPFSTFMEIALYDVHSGFFASGHGAPGRGGDFLTSPEVGPLFGAVIARYLDRVWEQLGWPDPFVVVEVGAGRGALAVAVRAAEPMCATAMHYVMVERSPFLRLQQAQHIPLADPTQVLGAVASDDRDRGWLGGTGPVFTSVPVLPAERITGVILANELLDNLPLDLLEVDENNGWDEVRVALDTSERGGAHEATGDLVFTEILVPVSEAHLSVVAGLGGNTFTAGSRVPVQDAAARFVQDACSLLEFGRLLCIDYSDTTSSMAGRPFTDWLRTYRHHFRGEGPLASPGTQDITCEVAMDQLARVRSPTRISLQADFLEEHGMAELVEEGRRTWSERAHLGDLAALRARSRVREAEALSDPVGLGAFTVAEWAV